MKTELTSKRLLIKASPIHGYGVFADENIDQGEIIEECHTLFVPDSHAKDSLYNYYFDFNNQSSLPLGRGVIYNHSSTPNCDYYCDVENSIMIFRSLKPIVKGEEIVVSYGSSWFSSRVAKKNSPKYKMHKIGLLLSRFIIICAALMFLLFILNSF